MFVRAANWLKSVQNRDGGWGESCASYDDPERFKAKGPSTASQTAWALMGLINSGESESQRGKQHTERAALHGAIVRGKARLESRSLNRRGA